MAGGNSLCSCVSSCCRRSACTGGFHGAISRDCSFVEEGAAGGELCVLLQHSEASTGVQRHFPGIGFVLLRILAGVDASVEALRRETRIEQVVALARAIRAHASASRTNVGPEVAAIGLVSLIENAASSWLTQDDVFLGLGRRRFVTETATLAQRMVG